MTHGLHRTRFGRPVLPQSLERTPPLGRFSDFLRRAANQEARSRGGLFRRGLRLGARTVHQLHREPLRCTAPSNPVSNIPLSHTRSLRRPPRLAPTSGVRISRFLPACVRRKQAQDPSSPSRTGGGTAGSCRCAPRPDALGWAQPPSVVNQIYQPKTDSGVPKASVHCPGKCQERCAHPSEPELPPQPAVGPSVVAWHARAVAATMGQCVAAVLLCVEERRRIDCMHPAIGRSCRLQSPGDRCGSSCASMPESTTRICC